MRRFLSDVHDLLVENADDHFGFILITFLALVTLAAMIVLSPLFIVLWVLGQLLTFFTGLFVNAN